MISIASIVEGHGEVQALPKLLRRLASECEHDAAIEALPPIRIRRDQFLNKDKEFSRQLLLAAAKSGNDGWILIVLDADDDCPASLGQKIYQRAQQYISHRRLSVVLANREFEAWFIAAAQSLQGFRGFSLMAGEKSIQGETRRNAKGWMKDHMQGGTRNSGSAGICRQNQPAAGIRQQPLVSQAMQGVANPRFRANLNLHGSHELEILLAVLMIKKQIK